MAPLVHHYLMSYNVTIIDYGMGNLCSVHNALQYLGARVRVCSDPANVAASETLVLPGVGSFRAGMLELKRRGLDYAIQEAVIGKRSTILGICLGMQIMGTRSTEDGDTQGLGLILSGVDRFSAPEIGHRKVPHIGFNAVTHEDSSRLFAGLPSASDFYFVHSFRMLPIEVPGLVASCEYGVKFMAAYEHDNIYATQFHPEKSQINGLWLLRNFLQQQYSC
jgi:glutamine amidotransferase